MSVRTRTHLTRDRSERSSGRIKKIEPRSSKRNKKSVSWRAVAKARIKKYTEVGLMVRGGRYKAGLTQKQLAELISVSPHHISEMEHGKRTVGRKMAQKLAKIFKVNYRVLL